MKIIDDGFITPSLQEQNPDLPVLSYSQLQVWDRCEYAWHYNYERNLVRKSVSNSGTLGLRIHSLLETHFSHVAEGAPWDDAIEFVESQLAAMTNDAYSNNLPVEIVQEIGRAGKLVLLFLRGPARGIYNGHVIMDVEKHFEVILETPSGFNFILQGYVDLVTAYQGKIYIEDHKSTANAAFWNPVEIMMDPQLTLYWYALRILGIPVHSIFYNFFNTYEYKKPVDNDKLFKREPSYRTEVELENFALELLTEVDRLVQAKENPNYKYRRSLRRDCKNCAYQQPCLYALKGIDPEPILLSNFIEKSKR